MKTWFQIALVAVVAPLAVPAVAQHEHAHMAAPAAVSAVASTLTFTDGVVKRVDKAGGRITISHDPIRNLEMPKMTMAFRVKDPNFLDRVKEGDRIRFAAESPNGVLTVVALDAVK